MTEDEMFDQLKYRIEVGRDGTRSYYNSAGQLHREEGPAQVYNNGRTAWFRNGELHREDGPAIDDGFGNRAWYINGQHHREDGPASEYMGGRKEYSLRGVYLSETEFLSIHPDERARYFR